MYKNPRKFFDGLKNGVLANGGFVTSEKLFRLRPVERKERGSDIGLFRVTISARRPEKANFISIW